MGTYAGPNIVTGSMSYFVDAGSRKSLNTVAAGWTDITGKMPTATFTNATFSATNVGIVSFGGTNSSQATVAESPYIQGFFSTGSRTFDVWVKRDQSVSTFNMVWGFWVPYLSMYNTSKFLFTYYTNTGSGNILQTHYSNQSFVNGRWYNVTCTIEYTLGVGSVSKIYIDGVLDSTLNWPSATTTNITTNPTPIAHNLILGGWHYGNPDTALRGSISNFRIYERVLTDAEILQNYNAMAPRFRPDVAEQAVLHIDAADRNSFTRVQDGWANLAGLSPTTLQLSGATYDSSNGGVLTFDGLPGSSASMTPAFTQTSEMTWDVWFNRTASTNSYNMVFSNNNLPYFSFLPNGQFLFSWYTQLLGSATQRTLYSGATNTYANGVWYNVTCTLVQNTTTGQSTARMYVNGVFINANISTTPLLDQVYQAGRLIIANYSNNGIYPFLGSISNLRIYRRILTDAEILQSYNALKTRFGY